jgi:hypothetical protein
VPVTIRATPKSPRLELYSRSAVLPTESPDEFAAHFQELRQELKPVGLLEESQVAVIAQLLWRKHRLSLFDDAAQAREFMRLEKAILRRENKARRMATQLQEKQEKLNPAYAELRDDKIVVMTCELIKQMCERDEEAGLSPPELTIEDDEDDEEQAALRNVTIERYTKDLELMERLDAAIEAALVRLEKYQRRRMTGSAMAPPARTRPPAWGRVRQ